MWKFCFSNFLERQEKKILECLQGLTLQKIQAETENCEKILAELSPKNIRVKIYLPSICKFPKPFIEFWWMERIKAVCIYKGEV